ncbi:MAG: bifunctional pyr operon transcriptional regulator/uracil phosphoribosyltransferase PyrR [Burkholderiaceae bacterium]|jgi:pyrimidine operon attenuation protein/uracil phosphoribosyltransferase|nr:bifunctional pyr operon transcriptional regulator/uracil phosphoribosyltransferase PyrR [Burkholderiaceae bacterium]
MSTTFLPPGLLTLDAEALYAELRRGVAALMTPRTCLAGIVSGGQWLAERLQADLEQDLGRPVTAGAITSALHRDDFARRGLGGGQTQLPFDIDGADVLLLDDVLYTGRTIRAVVNELFDYGRPARVRLAVLVDRGGRELPVSADFSAARVALPAHQLLALARQGNDGRGRLTFRIDEAAA